MPAPSRVRVTAAKVAELGNGGPVRTQVLLAGGLTSAQIKAAARARSITALHRGIWLPTQIWIDADQPTRLRLAIRAAREAFPDTCVSHMTASSIWDLPGLGFDQSAEQANRYPLDQTDTAIPMVYLTRPGTRITRGRIMVRDAPLHEDWIVDVDGLPVTDPIRTALDCAGALTDPEALALLDAGCRLYLSRHVNPRQLRAAIYEDRLPVDWQAALAERFTGRLPWRAARRMVRIVEYVNPAAESPLESIARWNMWRAGLPMPQCQMPIQLPSGQVVWVDFGWRAQRVVGEADGMGKYATREDLVAEKRRQEALEQAGWRVVRWDWNEGVVQPTLMTSRIRAALDA